MLLSTPGCPARFVSLRQACRCRAEAYLLGSAPETAAPGARPRGKASVKLLLMRALVAREDRNFARPTSAVRYRGVCRLPGRICPGRKTRDSTAERKFLRLPYGSCGARCDLSDLVS